MGEGGGEELEEGSYGLNCWVYNAGANVSHSGSSDGV